MAVSLNRLKRIKTLSNQKKFLSGLEDDVEYEKGPSISSIKLNPGKYVACLGEILSPSLFFCSLYDPKDEFDYHLNLFYTMHDEFYSLTSGLPVGAICVAKFSADNMWYRGIILEVQSPQSRNLQITNYFIHFIDFGNSEWVKQCNIRKLDAGFASRPIQAFLCGLVELFSSEKYDWLAGDVTKFVEYATSNNLYVYIEVVDLSNNSSLLNHRRLYYPIVLPNPSRIRAEESFENVEISDVYKWMLENLSARELHIASSLELLDDCIVSKFNDRLNLLSDHRIITKPNFEECKSSSVWEVHPEKVDFSIAQYKAMRPAPTLPEFVSQFQNSAKSSISSISEPRVVNEPNVNDKTGPNLTHNSFTIEKQKVSNLPLSLPQNNVVDEWDNGWQVNYTDACPDQPLAAATQQNGAPFYSFNSKQPANQPISDLSQTDHTHNNGNVFSANSKMIINSPPHSSGLSTGITAETKSGPSSPSGKMPPPQWFPQPKTKTKKSKSSRSKSSSSTCIADENGDSGSTSSQSSKKKDKKNGRSSQSGNSIEDTVKNSTKTSNNVAEVFVVSSLKDDYSTDISQPNPHLSMRNGINSSPIRLFSDVKQLSQVSSSLQSTPNKLTEEMKELLENLDDPDSAESNEEQERCASPQYLGMCPPSSNFDYPDGFAVPSGIADVPATVLPSKEFDALVMSATNSPDCFYITPLTPEYKAMIQWIESALCQHYCIMTASTFDKFFDIELSPGSFCLVDSLDSLFRCYIIREIDPYVDIEHKSRRRMPTSKLTVEIRKLELKPPGSENRKEIKYYECLSIDYGDRFKVSSACIYPMSPQFAEIPRLSVKCRLKDIRPATQDSTAWSKESLELFEKSLGNSEYKVRVFLDEKPTFNEEELAMDDCAVVPVYLFLKTPMENGVSDSSLDRNEPTDFHSISVNEQMVRLNFALASGIVAQIMENETGGVLRETVEDQYENYDPRRDVFIREKIRDYFEEDAKAWGCADQYKKPVCGNFRNFGRCKFGRSCKFRHVQHSDDEEEDEVENAAIEQFYKELIILSDGEVEKRELPEKGSWISIIPTCLYKTMNFYALLEFGSDRLDSLDFKGSSEINCLEHLNQLNAAINSYYENTLLSAYFKKFYYPIGSRIAACYDTDGKYYRAKVVDHDPKINKMEIVYEDYGEVDYVSTSCIFPLTRRFFDELPPQAVECFFDGITLPEDQSQYSKLALEFVDKQISFRRLHARVTEVTPTGQLYLEVYNFSDSLGVMGLNDSRYDSINTKLVKLGYAAKVSSQVREPVAYNTKVCKYYPG